jgi:shikimate dehydrogenase
VAGVIGDPIAHSLSPAIFNAAFRELGLDWTFVAFPVAAGGAKAALDAMRVLDLSAFSVTMPHKEDVAAAADELTAAAERLGAANTVVNRSGRLVAGSTDGAGLVDALRADAEFDPAGRRCVVLGAGGAARSVILALAEAGAADVAVIGRTPGRVAACEPLGGRVGSAARDVPDADLVVNATPVGMTDDGLPLDPALLRADQVVVDLIYRPAVTPLLAAARERGAAAHNGLSMLVHQAGHQLRFWTGLEPPLEAMFAAVA